MLSRLIPWNGAVIGAAADDDEGREEEEEEPPAPLTLPPLRVLPFPANALDDPVDPLECFSTAAVSLFLSAPRIVSRTALFLMKRNVGMAETPYACEVARLVSLGG